MPCQVDEWETLVRRGDYAGAWSIDQQVLAARDPATRDDPSLPYHLRWVWDGSAFANRHVLVRCYHGLGDTIQFARFLPLLGSCAASLSVEAQPELIPLLRGLPNIDRLLPFIRDKPAPPSECDIEIMELAFALRAPPDAAGAPYLSSPPAPLPRKTVGLCWKVGDWDPDRALPRSLFRPFTSHPCVALVPGRTELEVLNPQGSPPDLAEAARLVAGVELVITVDTMIAHLAGAMNRPTWLLLKHQADWRWMDGREDSPWYPSMRLYRQPAPGDWPAVLARVMQDFSEWKGA